MYIVICLANKRWISLGFLDWASGSLYTPVPYLIRFIGVGLSMQEYVSPQFATLIWHFTHINLNFTSWVFLFVVMVVKDSLCPSNESRMSCHVFLAHGKRPESDKESSIGV